MKLPDLQDLAWMRAIACSGEARRLRLSRRMTLNDIATSCGVSHVTVLRWETGERVPRGAPALQYARILRMLAATESPVAS